MTAGRGLIHEEISSPEFKAKGGPLEILQLWINLPKRLKMTDPKYTGYQKGQIPMFSHDNSRVRAEVIAGHFGGMAGAFRSLTDVNLSILRIVQEAEYQFKVPVDRNIFFYLISGEVYVNERNAQGFQLVEFNNDNENIVIKAIKDTVILYGDAIPFNEPVVAQGPFVMNTEEEIRQAYEDYRNGLFG